MERDFVWKSEVGDRLGLGPRQVPSFLFWMKDLDFLRISQGRVLPTKTFLQMISMDKELTAEKNWLGVIMRLSSPWSHLEFVNWYLNFFPIEKPFDREQLAEKYMTFAEKKYAQRTMQNAFASLRSFFQNTPLGKHFGFFQFMGKNPKASKIYVKKPENFSAEVILRYLEEKHPDPGETLERILIEEQKPGGILRVLGSEIRPILFQFKG